jgi:DNA repair protein RadC
MLQMTTAYTRNDSEVVKETQARLYESDKGIESLNEGELLHLILGSGTKNNPLQEIVNEILSLKTEFSLKGLQPEYLQSKVSGLTKKKAEMLIASIELGRRIYTEEPVVGHTIRSPEDAASLLDYMKHHKQEHFVVLFLNTKNVVIGKKTVFIGSLNTAVVHPREIFHEAIQRSAASIIVAHSHPSGDPNPSREDIDVTKRLKEAGQLIGIDVLDHVIVGYNRYVSLKEKGSL